MNATSRRIRKLLADTPPYTAAHLRDIEYKGSLLEQADRAVGGPAQRKRIREYIEKHVQITDDLLVSGCVIAEFSDKPKDFK